MSDSQDAASGRSRLILILLVLAVAAVVLRSRRGGAREIEAPGPAAPPDGAARHTRDVRDAAPLARPPGETAGPSPGTDRTEPSAAAMESGTGPGSAGREEPGPYGPGSARPGPDGAPPGPGYTIKAKVGSRLFHPPTSPYYARTKADVWFQSAEVARAAGFSEYARRKRQG